MGKWLLVINDPNRSRPAGCTDWVNSVTGVKVTWVDNRTGSFGGGYTHEVNLYAGGSTSIVWRGDSPDPAAAFAFLRDIFGIEAGDAARGTPAG